MLSLTEEDTGLEWMKQHDPKFNRISFCYDYLNSKSLSEKKQQFQSSDYFQSYSQTELEQESYVTPKTYVPTLVLEEKILELENLLKDFTI